ncbi:hypothetical protein J6590_016339 [Homalodisca vitripennis]|nr:hypothetical protein J6590_016339 [Homalodisca vitripennis]
MCVGRELGVKPCHQSMCLSHLIPPCHTHTAREMCVGRELGVKPCHQSMCLSHLIPPCHTHTSVAGRYASCVRSAGNVCLDDTDALR